MQQKRMCVVLHELGRGEIRLRRAEHQIEKCTRHGARNGHAGGVVYGQAKAYEPRRVAARLIGFGLAIDDSAGVPIARTVPGAFLDLVLGAAETNFAPPELMTLLKHPLLLLGREPVAIRDTARALERGAFRDIYVGQGLDGIAQTLDVARAEPKPRRLALTEKEHNDALCLVADLKQAFAPLAELFASPSSHSAARIAEAHAATAEALARDPTESSGRLWQGDAGEALTMPVSYTHLTLPT